VESVYDLLNVKKLPPEAIPVLVEWLPRARTPRIKEGIVLALGRRKAGKEVMRALIAALEEALDKMNPGLRSALGNSICIAAQPEDFEELLRLTRDRRYGSAREMLAIALGKHAGKHKDVAMKALIELLDDPLVHGHAVTGLRHLGMEGSRAAIERMLTHQKGWIRKEARAALAKLDKRKARS
jgi:hypothetical protein